MKFIFPCVASFMLTVVITPLVIRFAKACKCLDVPGGRRAHKKVTPRWGGVAFFVGVLPFMFMENESGALTSFIVASCFLVGMGIIDDLKSLGWKTKFAGMAIAATIVIFGGNIAVHHIGTYGSLGRLDLGRLSIPFTYLSIIGITNAINLLDGLNGLAGGVSLLGFLFMGIAAVIAGNIVVALVCFAFVGALGAFLLYNFPNARIFMGDSGSTFLGFSLSIMAVFLTQDANSSVDSMFPVLVLLIPIFDTLRVLFVRLLNGKNPFQADNLHLHYLIVENLSPMKVALLFWSLTAVFGSIALTLTGKTSVSYLAVVLYASLLLSLFAISLTQRRPQEKGRLKTLRPAGMSADSSVLMPYDDAGPDFARKGEMMMTLKWLVVLGIVLLTAQVSAGEPQDLKTQKDKVNYAIGVNMINSLKMQGVEIDLDLVIKGMRDAHSGGKLLLPDDELRKSIGVYQTAARQKQAMVRVIAADENKKAGEAFLAANAQKEGVVTLPSGLQYKTLKAGDGMKPTDADTVEVNYRGALINGTEFDSTEPGKPAALKVAQLIAGWKEAMKLMPVGSKWQIFIPSRLAYGERGSGKQIGPNATLVFEVELLAIK
ncbi:FKBP-type peptidyl-prolyl cis-trans isomerase [Geotalea uraniireducens]|uniref:peptidylprolyl isomerase n=1 Tax=Geotalea uraniireducens (strain Rf4) TaxID=351605 RepID=A5G600_GEOUR|nr:FKBP-type peptidyl-prolyl cis-trans isomerase [Geotalea uraniireducens]ABQ27218.1 peptidylprolyl isomerase, FKBP-type [Geotalea uraniireducens Rf4]